MRKSFLQSIFPRRCVSCHSTWAYLCAWCKKSLIPHPELCPVCHVKSSDFVICRQCRDRVNYRSIMVLFHYTGVLKKLILKLKYYHVSDVAEFLAERLRYGLLTNATFQSDIQHRPVIITRVASHRYRHYFVKWYNQSEILATAVGQILWYTTLQLVKKHKHTASQAQLKRGERLKNLTGSFHSCASLQGNEVIVIVDDIATTGSSIQAIAQTLHATYPDVVVRWLVVGRNNS